MSRDFVIRAIKWKRESLNEEREYLSKFIAWAVQLICRFLLWSVSRILFQRTWCLSRPIECGNGWRDEHCHERDEHSEDLPFESTHLKLCRYQKKFEYWLIMGKNKQTIDQINATWCLSWPTRREQSVLSQDILKTISRQSQDAAWKLVQLPTIALSTHS